jgi:peptidoglycan hydrolase CwlO-like protein
MSKIILFLLLIIPTVSSANFSVGYAVGRSSVYCSCTNEDYRIRELERENQRLKEELEKLQAKEEQ